MKIVGFKNSIKILGEILRKNSPTILTSLSVAGLLTTVILAVKVTPEAVDKIKADSRKNHDGDPYAYTKKEAIVSAWQYYVPAVAMGTFTTSCIVMSNSINLRRNAALASMYSLTETTLKEYQAKVVETIGQKKEKAITDAIAEDKVKNNPVGAELIITGKGNHLCFDILSGRYFESDIEKIRKLQNDINHKLISEMWVSLNDVYSKMGLPNIAIGDDMGWNVDKMMEFVFTSALTESGEPCIVIDHQVMPFSTFRS